MIRIATWNVNSINARLETVLDWIKEATPDVVGFQELKCVDEKFPREAFEDLGYNVHVHGQKSYNGVALLSKFPVEDIRRGLPGEDGHDNGEDHSRYIEGVIGAPTPFRFGWIVARPELMQHMFNLLLSMLVHVFIIVAFGDTTGGMARSRPSPHGPVWKMSRAKIGSSAVAPASSTATRSSVMAPRMIGLFQMNL